MFTEDLASMFSTRDFAVEALYDGATTVNVIFDNSYLDAVGIAGTNPVAIGRASDFPAAAVSKTLVIAGTTYRIRNLQPQDDGALVALQLERQ